jgi:hypothetical protein
MLLIELVEPIHSCQAPPFQIDDSWEEEVVVQNNILFGTSLVIIGTKSSIQSTCSSLSIPYMNWIQSNTKIMETSEQEYLPQKPKLIPKLIQKPIQKTLIKSSIHTGKNYRPICLISTD